MNRFFFKRRFLYVFFFTTLVFFLGLFLGNLMANSKLQDIEDIQQNLQIQTTTTEIEYLLFSEEPCLLEVSDTLGNQLYQLGEKLTFMEGQIGEKNEKVSVLKEYYSLLEMRHWLLLKKIKNECATDYNIVLYFYSENCKQCDEQGFLLTYLREKYPSLRLKVYSFDMDLENSALSSLQKLYGVTNYPTLVINEKIYPNFVNRKQFEEIFDVEISEILK